jgi:hypothetical protein
VGRSCEPEGRGNLSAVIRLLCRLRAPRNDVFVLSLRWAVAASRRRGRQQSNQLRDRRYFNTNFAIRHNIISDNERWYNALMATQRKIKVTTLDEIKEVIGQNRAGLKSQFHVEKIGVFGSCACGDQKKRSDADFLVTFE